MNKEKYKKKALNDIFRNAHLAILAIDVVLKDVSDKGLKDEIKRQRAGYKNFVDEIIEYSKKTGYRLKDTCGVKKFFMRVGINCNTLFDKSKNHIATIMIKGTVMGVAELYAMKNENKNLSREEYELLEKLLNLEEEYEKNLKKYL